MPTGKAASVALFAAGIRAAMVFQAFHIDKRELKRACICGNGNGSPSFMSLAESPMTGSLTTWMLTKASGHLA